MMDIIRSIVLILFHILFLFSTQNYFFMFTFGMNIICKESERTALLSFKQGLKDPSDSLSSWSGENCCSWVGVHCHNKTNHVVELQLHDLGLSGEINPFLQELKQLTHLDLSSNDFDRIRIPDFLGTLQSLRYLDLSNSAFSGLIPHQLGNLSNLRYLDLRSEYNYLYVLNVGNFQWLSHLCSLEHLDLSYANLQNAYCLHAISMLPSLLFLRLSHCALSGALPSLSHVNFTSLAVLSLRGNYLNSTLPEWLYSLTNLEQLNLWDNYFQGRISASIGNLTKLTHLDLSSNQLEGEIPITLGNLCNLQTMRLSSNTLKGEISGILGSSIGCIAGSLQSLDLSSNQLSGPLPYQLGRLQNLGYLSLGSNSFYGSIPFTIGRLALLMDLDLSRNELNGSVPESLGYLSKLETLCLSYNALEVIVSDVLFSTLTSLQEIELHSLVFKVSPEWRPPFQLRHAKLGNCRLGPMFPNWLHTQKHLKQLDLSSNGISGKVPTWFWNLSSQFTYLNLSHNHFNGELPKLLLKDYSFSEGIYLNSNQFKGPLPRLGYGVVELDLSNNLLSGPISALLCNPFAEQNDFLQVLDLSNNLLSGDLSQCWFYYWKTLRLVKLGSNNITGEIPSSMGSLHNLQSLHLQNNTLFGELPSSLSNCTLLVTVDIGENALTGRLPVWLGESFRNLIVLSLRQNKFYGEIPKEVCGMTSIQILDLAYNNLSGSIPRCFSNFNAMVTKQNSSTLISYSISRGSVEATTLVTKDRELEYSKTNDIVETTKLVTKGREFEYSNTLTLVTSMDLSKNNLSGEIPKELTNLIGLIFLNLSWNCFTGKIPEKIGNMSLLESLDLSNNNISGTIPQGISGLYFLSCLNLSYNNLSGKIPSSTQLQLLTEFSFIGNEDLYGPPLNMCEEPPQKVGDREVKDEVWFEMKWFYMSMGVGFAVGFWALWGVIILKGSWRIAYFRFLDDMKEKLCLLF